ncbi:hypothetical protein [Eisenbergiella sp.]
MTTEKFTLIFFGIDAKYYTNEFVAHLWEESADKEYKRRGIYVTARTEINSLVCGKIRGCKMGDAAHVVISVRNPVEVRDKNAFWESYKNISQEVRSRLGNPSMTISCEKIEYFFFTEL